MQISTWNHGCALSKSEAGMVLQNAPVNTWLLRSSPKRQTFVITYKLHNRVAHNHFEPKGISKLNQVLSSSYPFEHLLLTTEIFKDCIYNYGSLTNRESKRLLENKPSGTWLLRFSEYHKKFVITQLVNRKLIQHIVNFNSFSLAQFLETRNPPVMLHQELGQLIPLTRTIPQINAVVLNTFFRNRMQEDESWKNYGVAKVSRKQFPNILNSHILIKEENLPLMPGQMPYSSTGEIKVIKLMHSNLSSIGKGGMKDYKFARLSEPRNIIAIGKYRDNIKDSINLYDLIEILRLVNGKPYISARIYCSLISYKSKEFSSYILANYAKCTLEERMLKDFKIGEKWKFTHHILKALDYLHANGIAHCDVKPDNVHLLDSEDGTGEIACLADFDFATTRSVVDPSTTPCYAAPEVLKEGKFNISLLKTADIYSTGSVLYEMHEGKHLWYEYNKPYEMERYFYQLKTMRLNQWEQLFTEPAAGTVKHLYWKMLSPNLSNRPSAQESLRIFEGLPKPIESNAASSQDLSKTN